MEKKTIGEFIAILRKANGLTQRQLAEMLGVSDKTVSRWERSETAPDLNLIPVIAEIFGITSDELLRGERKVQSSDVPGSAEPFTPRGEKQIQSILTSAKTKYWIRSMISVVIAVIGVILAIGCAQLFQRSSDGFTAGLVVILVTYLAAVPCQIVSAITTFVSINSEEFDGEPMDKLKRKIVKIALYIVSGLGILGVVGIVTICGFEVFEWAFLAPLWAAVAAAVYVILWQIVKHSLIKHGCEFLQRKTDDKTSA